MSLPNPVLPDRSVAVSRRCARRCLFLRPSREANEFVGYCLGVARRNHPSVRLSALAVLGNHHHQVAGDEEGELSSFYRDFHGLLARGLNCVLGRGETFWAPGGTPKVLICDEESLWEQLVYVAVNPVRHGLVEKPELWPGLISRPEDVGTKTFRFERPEKFFRHDVPDALPPVVEFQLELPLEFADMDPEAFRQEYRRRVDERVAKLRAERKREGLGFTTPQQIRDQNPLDSVGDTFPDRDLSPRVACKDPARRAGMLLWISTFRLAHWCAWQLWSRGDREVLFPYGTYLMQRRYRVRCRDPDEHRYPLAEDEAGRLAA